MTFFIGISRMNSILTAAKACDDSKAILEGIITDPGIQVVADNDPRSYDIDVMFMYPNGARAAQQQVKDGKIPSLENWISRPFP